MSFDIKIKNGDFTVGNDGDVAKVRDAEKLTQDILKFVMTPAGSNKFYLWYGSFLSQNMIGQVFDKVFVSSNIENQISTNLNTLQRLQKEQYGKGQRVTPNELLGATKSIDANRNIADPTMFDISIDVVTKGFQNVNANLQMSL